jgi:hypothetical protein
MARAKTSEGASTAADRGPKPSAQPATVSDGDIAHRAYDLYLARDRKHGHDVEDWLQAESDLRATSTTD